MTFTLRSLKAMAFGLILSAQGLPAADAKPEADTVLINGKIFTADPAKPWAEALSIRGDKIDRVGTNEQVNRTVGDETQVIDLEGRLVIPGLNDAHVHVPIVPQGINLDTGNFVPGPGPTLNEVLDLVEQAAATAEPGTWIFGVVGEAVIDDPQANRFALDAVAPNNPVRLVVWAGHGTVINTKAMEVAGIGEEEPNPLGGTYERVENSQVITGVLREYAETHLRRFLMQSVPVPEARAQFTQFAETVASMGVTSIQELPFNLPKNEAEAVLRDLELPVRVRSICFPLSPDESCQSTLPRNDDMVTSSGVKWILDGSPIERFAALREEYSDRAGWQGQFNLPPEVLDQILNQGLRGPLPANQMVLHGVGDRAVDEILAALERTANPRRWRHRRVRLEHGDLVQPEHIERLARMRVTVVQNPLHFAIPETLHARFGEERLAVAQPLRSLLEAGVPVALGTDSVVGPSSPFLDILFAVIHPTNPAEAISLEEAIIAYTYGSARAEFQEKKKGRLARGYLADLAVLSQDLFTTAPFDWPATQSVLTVVGGRVVHGNLDASE